MLALNLSAGGIRADAASSSALEKRVTDAYFGTITTFLIQDDLSAPEDRERFENCWSAIKASFAAIDQAVSLAQADSDLARLNRLSAGESCLVSETTAELLQLAGELYDQSLGYFDPSVEPLVDLWGFSPRFRRSVFALERVYDRLPVDGKLPNPEPEQITALLPLVGFSAFEIEILAEGARVTKQQAGVSLEGEIIEAQLGLGALAKGYALDQAMALVRAAGFSQGYLSVGGSSIAFLNNSEADSGSFSVGLGGLVDRLPAPPVYALELELRQMALSTSSDQTRRRVQDGVVYAHILDPGTGWPMNTGPGVLAGTTGGIAQATVIGESAARCDGLSTALCLMEPGEAIAWVNEHGQDYEVVLLLYDDRESGGEIISNLNPSCLLERDPRYSLAYRLNEQGEIEYTGTFFVDRLWNDE